MALARPRPSRPTAPRPSTRPAPVESDALDAGEEGTLADLVAAAAEANERSMRDVADAMGVGRAELDALLLRPASLARDAVDRLARALGVDRGLFRRAVEAAAARDPSPAVDADEPVDAPDAARTAAPPPAPAEPPPLEAIDVVARALAAIVDPADGADPSLRLRPAVLDAARQAARDAGRQVPPAWRDVASALRAPTVAAEPDADDPSVADDRAPESAAARDAAVVAAAARAVRALQQLAPGYDDVFSPVPDDALETLLRRLTIRVHRAPLGATTASALVAPPFGRYLLVCAADATPDQRRLVVRRAAAHVVAGHVRGDAPLPVPAPVDGPFDRVADVAALADLIPFWLVHDLRRARGGRKAATAHVAALAARIAGDWDEARARDRAALRVELHRAHGL